MFLICPLQRHNQNRNHGLRDRASHVNGDWLYQWEMAIFDPKQNPHPLTNHQKKIVTGDYVSDPYGCDKFGANPFMGLLGKWVKYNKNFIYLFIPFFGNSPTGQTRRQILKLDGSNDADSLKSVFFGGFVDIAPHFEGEIPPPQKKQFLGRD